MALNVLKVTEYRWLSTAGMLCSQSKRPIRAKIGRTRLRSDGDTLPSFGSAAPKPENAGRHKGDAHDVAEDGLVLMPTDRGAGRILGHERRVEDPPAKSRQIRPPALEAGGDKPACPRSAGVHAR